MSLDELWRVARGEVKYADFLSNRSGAKPAKDVPRVPEELVRPHTICDALLGFKEHLYQSCSRSRCHG